MGVVHARQQIQGSGGSLDRVHAKSAASQWSAGRDIAGRCDRNRHSQTRTRAARNHGRSGLRRRSHSRWLWGDAVGEIVGGVYRVGVKYQLVVESLAHGIERDVQILGLAVSAGHRKAQIQARRPSLPAGQGAGSSRMPPARLGCAANVTEAFRCLHWPRRLGCDNDVVTVRGHWSDHRLAAQTDVQVARRKSCFGSHQTSPLRRRHSRS